MLTFTAVQQQAGSNRLFVNVSDPNGKPFGQLWTFSDSKSEWHPWQVSTVSGDYHAAIGGDAYQSADDKKVALVDAMIAVQAHYYRTKAVR
jgi:hypothetical protein